MTQIRLPTPAGTVETYTMGRTAPVTVTAGGAPTSRVAYAAAHVVADPLADIDPVAQTAVDWDATLAFRRHLWSLGLGVAEAMDTAQRGMGLDWPSVRDLIRRSVGEADGALIVCGVGTDQLSPGRHGIDDVVRAYEEQLEFVEGLGGRAVLMASRALAAAASTPDDYIALYGRLLEQASQPVILHWLGDMFDPLLAGYWGHEDVKAAGDVVIGLIADHVDVVDGVKVSLLDADFEVALRRRLPEGVRCYTGDDFNYPALIAGDADGHSDALLGIFDGIAPVAREALAALDAGDRGRYEKLLAPTVPLARHIFSTPTYHYKTGIVFLAYLAGHQDHFRMVGAMESARSPVHLAELVRLADAAGLLPDPDFAAQRARHVMALAGVDA